MSENDVVLNNKKIIKYVSCMWNIKPLKRLESVFCEIVDSTPIRKGRLTSCARVSSRKLVCVKNGWWLLFRTDRAFPYIKIHKFIGISQYSAWRLQKSTFSQIPERKRLSQGFVMFLRMFSGLGWRQIHRSFELPDKLTCLNLKNCLKN